MISNLDPSSELFLANLERIQQRLQEAGRQVSSGKRISDASDASPDQIGALLQLRADQQHNQQILGNLAAAKGETDAADAALSGAVKLMDRALVLASSGSSSTQTAETRTIFAAEIQTIQTRMVAFSQTTVQGRNTFSPTVSEGTRAIEDPAGGSFAATKTAEEVFNSTNDADNVYKALENLRLALVANDPDAVTAAIDPIKSATAHLNSMQSFFGHVQSRIQSATDYISAFDTRLSAQISQLEDADVPAAITEMMEANVQLQATFEMRAKMRQSSLFDYLG